MSYLAHRGTQHANNVSMHTHLKERMVIGVDGKPLPMPSATPTACLPPASAPSAHVVLANRLAGLVSDLRMGRIDETDQTLIAAMLRTLGL